MSRMANCKKYFRSIGKSPPYKYIDLLDRRNYRKPSAKLGTGQLWEMSYHVRTIQ
jgi:hypothetical protein